MWYESLLATQTQFRYLISSFFEDQSHTSTQHWKVNPTDQNITHLSLQTIHVSRCLEAKRWSSPFLSNWVISTSAANKDKVISSVFIFKHIIWLDFICVREFYPSLHTMQRTRFLSLILNFLTINFIDRVAGFQIKEK